MARRYQIDELLWLRSSPLVTKPSNLPPVEEWMGYEKYRSLSVTILISPAGSHDTDNSTHYQSDP